MGDPETNGGDSGKVADVVPAEKPERPVRRSASSRVLSAVDRERILADARATEFPAALRGYDRAAVDRYVEKVNRLLTELEMSSSPEAAVKHALDEVSEETREILQHAHKTAEEITARSRQRADERLETADLEARQLRDGAQAEAQRLRSAAQAEAARVRETATRETAELRQRVAQEVKELREAARRETEEQRAKAEREAQELREAAEGRARDLARSAETVWRERRRLIDDMRGVGEQLIAIGEVEGKRFAQPPGEGATAAEPQPQET